MNLGQKKKSYALWKGDTYKRHLHLQNYILTALPNTPGETILRLQLIFKNFFWGGKQNKIRKGVAFRPLGKGGLGMFNHLM